MLDCWLLMVCLHADCWLGFVAVLHVRCFCFVGFAIGFD